MRALHLTFSINSLKQLKEMLGAPFYLLLSLKNKIKKGINDYDTDILEYWRLLIYTPHSKILLPCLYTYILPLLSLLLFFLFVC